MIPGTLSIIIIRSIIAINILIIYYQYLLFSQHETLSTLFANDSATLADVLMTFDIFLVQNRGTAIWTWTQCKHAIVVDMRLKCTINQS